jgi:hypothetical protein
MKAHQATHPMARARHSPVSSPCGTAMCAATTAAHAHRPRAPAAPISHVRRTPPPFLSLRGSCLYHPFPLPFLLHIVIRCASLKCPGSCRPLLFPRITFSRQEHAEVAYFPPVTSRPTLITKVTVSSSHFEPSPSQLPPLGELPPWLLLLFDLVTCDMLFCSL